jgi:hypothetical protein
MAPRWLYGGGMISAGHRFQVLFRFDALLICASVNDARLYRQPV